MLNSMYLIICLTFISHLLIVSSRLISTRLNVSYGSPAYMYCECGRANTKFTEDSRILGGNETRPNEYPWMVLILGIDTDSTMQLICGGSIISDRYIITAAHCLRPKKYTQERMKVVLGEHDLCSPDTATVIFSIEKLIQHPKYTLSKGLIADAMLIQLNMKITFNARIRPICLPKKRKPTTELTYFSRSGDILGWGIGDIPGISCTLRKTSLTVYESEKCNFKSFYLFCAGYSEKSRDSCAGDSGGPFQLLNDEAKYELIGITSSGYGCGNEGTPGLYTDVIRILPWIYQTIQDSMFCWK